MDWDEIIEETDSNDSGQDGIDKTIQEVSEVKINSENPSTKVISKYNDKKELREK